MLVTVSEVKDFIPLSGSTYDTLLTTLIGYVQEMMEHYIGRTIESTSYTEYYDADGNSNELYLNQYPLITLTTVNVDRNYDFAASTDYTLADDVVSDLPKGRVIKRVGNWPKGKQHIKVVYTAGYATVPDDIKFACIYWTSRVFTYVTQDRRDRESITYPGGQNISLKTEEPPVLVKMILDKRFKRRV